MWTWFKAPDDVFTVYNNLPIKKFSIFQKIIAGESSSFSDENMRKNKKSTVYNRLSDQNGAADARDNNEDRRRMSESMLSEDGVNQLVGQDEYNRGSTLSKRSI